MSEIGESSTPLHTLFALQVPRREACMGAALFLVNGNAHHLLAERFYAGAVQTYSALATLPVRWARELAYEVLQEDEACIPHRRD